MSSTLVDKKKTLLNKLYYLRKSKILLIKQKYQFSTILSSRYFEFLDIFFKKKINILLSYSFYNYTIYFKENIQFLVFILYNIRYNKTLKVCCYLNKNLSKKFI